MRTDFVGVRSGGCLMPDGQYNVVGGGLVSDEVGHFGSVEADSLKTSFTITEGAFETFVQFVSWAAGGADSEVQVEVDQFGSMDVYLPKTFFASIEGGSEVFVQFEIVDEGGAGSELLAVVDRFGSENVDFSKFLRASLLIPDLGGGGTTTFRGFEFFKGKTKVF